MIKIKKVNIPSVKDYYYVDEFGNVYSNYSGKLKKLKLSEDKDGYYFISLNCIDGKRKNLRVNRIVAITYIPNPNNYPVVNHIDNDKKNNYVENLEWCTISYNTKEGYRSRDYHYKKKIKAYFVDKNKEMVFDSVKECASYFGISYFDISKIANGKIKHRKNGKIKNVTFSFV